MKYDIIALGELLIDFTCTGTDEAGYPMMAAHPGGAPANFLAAAAKAGGRTALLGKVGDDVFGHLLAHTLEQAGIDTAGLLSDPACFTTLAFVTLDEQGDRTFSFARKPGADTQLRFEELSLSMLDQAKLFHFGSLSLTDQPVREATVRAVGYARERGKLISYDPNWRPPLWHSEDEARLQLLWGLRQTDIVKISDDEVRFLFGCGPEEGAERILYEYGAQLVFVTCGADGCWFQNRLARGHEDSLAELAVVDTTGAGDIFGGSAVMQLLLTGRQPGQLDEAALRAVVRYATAAAGLSTTRPGGISSVPSREEVLARL